MLKYIILASAVGLMATPAFADPDKDESGNGREWRDDRRDGDRYYGGDQDRYRGDRLSGHMPPPGDCRVWFPGRPAGQQPAPTSCNRAERQAERYGGRVIYGSRSASYRNWDGNNNRQFQRWALRNFDYNQNGRLSQREYHAAMYAWNHR
jgi:hypothetical protein